jgi:hypothetical protein
MKTGKIAKASTLNGPDVKGAWACMAGACREQESHELYSGVLGRASGCFGRGLDAHANVPAEI